MKILSAENIADVNKAACQSIPSFRTIGKHTNAIQALLPILKIQWAFHFKGSYCCELVFVIWFPFIIYLHLYSKWLLRSHVSVSLPGHASLLHLPPQHLHRSKRIWLITRTVKQKNCWLSQERETGSLRFLRLIRSHFAWGMIKKFFFFTAVHQFKLKRLKINASVCMDFFLNRSINVFYINYIKRQIYYHYNKCLFRAVH